MRNSDLGLFSAFVVLVLVSFGVTNGYVRHRAHAIDQAALNIADNAAPSILHLSTAHREVKDLELSVNHYLEQAERGIFLPTRALDEASDRILAAKRLHETYPQFPGEHALSERAHGGKVGVRSALGRGSLFWIELPKC